MANIERLGRFRRRPTLIKYFNTLLSSCNRTLLDVASVFGRPIDWGMHLETTRTRPCQPLVVVTAVIGLENIFSRATIIRLGSSTLLALVSVGPDEKELPVQPVNAIYVWACF